MGNQKMDAVLPFIMADSERYKILYKSVKAHFKDLGTCWVVVPDREYHSVNILIRDPQFKIIRESELIPEVKYMAKPEGWFTQQLIKLSIAEKIDTDFYLTLDADVICTRDIYYNDIIKDGRALNFLGAVFHHDWHQWAERVLGLPSPGADCCVTPSVLSKEAVLLLHKHLSLRINPISKLISKLFPQKSLTRSYFGSWKGYLVRNFPWTEYVLYFNFLLAKGLFEKYHYVDEGKALYDGLKCVWVKEDFETWDVDKVFTDTNFFFTVVQAKRGIAQAEILEKIGKYLD